MHLNKKFIYNLFIAICIVVSADIIEVQSATLQESNDDSTIVIGDLEWVLENLNVVKFNNGDVIPEAKTPAEWVTARKEGLQ